MNIELQRDVFRILKESQSKYVYFLLAAAGAGIGFALNQTNNTTLSYSQLPLGFSVLMWGWSFYCGCKYMMYVNSNLFANYDLIRVQDGIHPKAENNPEYIEAACKGILEAIEHNSNIAGCYGKWQFRSLITGAVFYIGWHVLEMYFMTVSTLIEFNS